MSLNATRGNHTCEHGINTDDVNEWNEHCLDPANKHRITGVTPCSDCKAPVMIDIPYKRLGPDGSHNLSIQCPECKKNSESNNAQVMKIDNPKEGYRMLEPHERQNPAAVEEQSQ